MHNQQGLYHPDYLRIKSIHFICYIAGDPSFVVDHTNAYLQHFEIRGRKRRQKGNLVRHVKVKCRTVDDVFEKPPFRCPGPGQNSLAAKLRASTRQRFAEKNPVS